VSIEQIQDSILVIIEEINSLRSELTGLVATMEAAYLANDLTFIRLVQEQYQELLNELEELSVHAAMAMATYFNLLESTGGINDGREEQAV
jgi:hypothetical protein